MLFVINGFTVISMGAEVSGQLEEAVVTNLLYHVVVVNDPGA